LKGSDKCSKPNGSEETQQSLEVAQLRKENSQTGQGVSSLASVLTGDLERDEEDVPSSPSMLEEGQIEPRQVAQSDVINAIWRQLQDGRVERERLRKQDEKLRQEFERRIEEKLERLADRLVQKVAEDVARVSEILHEQFKAEVDKLNEGLIKRYERETDNLTQTVTNFQEETRQEILIVNEKVERMAERMNDELTQSVAEAKASQEGWLRNLRSHKEEVERSLGSFRTEMRELSKSVTEGNISKLQERLEKAGSDNASKLGRLATRLDTLEEVMSAGSCHVIHRHGEGDRVPHEGVSCCVEREIPSPNPAGRLGSRNACENLVDGNSSRIRNGGDDNVLSGSENMLNEMSEFRGKAVQKKIQGDSHILGDIPLPAFNDNNKQNIAQFLAELDQYFVLKAVLEDLKLPVALKAIKDDYTKQWSLTIYKDLKDYEHLKVAVTELLWNQNTQANARCAFYQDKYDRTVDLSMSAHFLRYSVMAANLTPRLSDVDTINAISGHFAPYVQRALLSANVHTVQDALNFLNKLESIEAGENNLKTNSGTQQSRQTPPDGQNYQNYGRNERGRPMYHNVRNTRYQGSPNYARNRGHTQNDRDYQNSSRDGRDASNRGRQAMRGGSRAGTNENQAASARQGNETLAN
jgi:hypothetical protein